MKCLFATLIMVFLAGEVTSTYSTEFGKVDGTIPKDITCTTIGLMSTHWEKYISAQKTGHRVRVDRDHKKTWETITIVQAGNNYVYLKSLWGRYLSAQPNGNLEWNRTAKKSWEKFKVVRSGDNIGFKSSHGKYVSAQRKGALDAKADKFLSWEEFTVVPSGCLKTDDCTQDLPINDKRWKLEDTKYTVSKGTVADIPIQGGIKRLFNKVSVAQSITLNVNEEVSESTSYTQTKGLAVTVGTEFSVGIPILADGKVSVDVTSSQEFTHGTEKTSTYSINAAFQCIAPPYTSVICTAFYYKLEVEVPYEFTWKSRRNSKCATRKTSGTYRDVSGHGLDMVVEETTVVSGKSKTVSRTEKIIA